MIDWLGDAPEPLPRPEGLTRLARRYLAGHGPADAADLAKWAGLPLRDARAGLKGIADELSSRPDGLVRLVGLPDLLEREAIPDVPLPPPRLLGAFDPLLLGWVSRAAFVGDHTTIVTSNGIFRPFALVDGRAVATWGLAGGTLTVRLWSRPHHRCSTLSVPTAPRWVGSWDWATRWPSSSTGDSGVAVAHSPAARSLPVSISPLRPCFQ